MQNGPEFTYNYGLNDPFDRSAPIRFAVPQLVASRAYMQSIRDFDVPTNGLAIWFFGQNGFVLKDPSGLLIGIDLYLTDSCAEKFAHQPYRLNRQLPIFVEPEDLDIDVFVTSHSHDDHADPETIRRFAQVRSAIFVGPWHSIQKYRDSGVPDKNCVLVHPGEEKAIGAGVTLKATFALPTDNTDLNHVGILIRSSNRIYFYNTGDTAYCELLQTLMPEHVDICAICINGGFHNLSYLQAAYIIKAIQPNVVIPCHYDMMINNIGSPTQFQVALKLVEATAECHVLRYYHPWVFLKTT